MAASFPLKTATLCSVSTLESCQFVPSMLYFAFPYVSVSVKGTIGSELAVVSVGDTWTFGVEAYGFIEAPSSVMVITAVGLPFTVICVSLSLAMVIPFRSID